MALSAIRSKRHGGKIGIAAAAILLVQCAPGPEEQEQAKGEGRRSASQVNATIDFSRTETLAEQVEKLSSEITGAGSPVALRLTILPMPGTQPDYRVSLISADGEQAHPVRCAGGEELAAHSFGFQFNPDYNHLLLTIRHGPPGQRVQARARCVPRGAGEAPALVIEGRYRAEVEEIPTAYDVMLIAQGS